MRKVAIVGGSPRGLRAPWTDPDWEKWVLGNQMDRWNPYMVHRIFEIHDNLTEHGDVKFYAQWLVNFNIPLVVSESFLNIKNVLRHANVDTFDKSKVPESFRGMLASSPAYMIAQAIQEKVDVIGIWGVDMAVADHEYFMQRPSMYAWIGYALGLGIRVEVDPGSPLFHDEYDEGRDWGNTDINTPELGGESKFARPPFTEAEFEHRASMHKALSEAAHINYANEQDEGQVDSLIADFHGHSGAAQVYVKLAQVARAVESGQCINSLSDVIVTK